MRVHIKNIDDDNYLIYFPNAMRFFVGNENLVNILNDIISNKSYEEIIQDHSSLSKEFYLQLFDILSIDISMERPDISEDILPRLVINISNACNLYCKYCYANGGTYSSQKTLMDNKTLLKVLDTFYSIFSKIEVIQLFGGEPLMNPSLILETCEYIKTYNKTTEVGIVTNGTIINQKIIDLIKTYNINVTFSIDHSSIHDQLRPYVNKKGSSHVIRNNLLKLKAATNQPSQIEVTYTKLHEEMGLSISEIITSLNKEFGKIPIHLTPVCTSKTDLKLTNTSAFIKSIDDGFKRRYSEEQFTYVFIERYLSNLCNKQNIYHFCNAGFGTLAVSVTGDIYPCFYFIDNPSFYVSNVNDDLERIRSDLRRIRKEYYDFNRKIQDKCKNCYANTICNGCIGVNYEETEEKYLSSDFHCDLVKNSLDKVLSMLSGRESKDGV